MTQLAPNNFYSDEHSKEIHILKVDGKNVEFRYDGKGEPVSISRAIAEDNIKRNLWIPKGDISPVTMSHPDAQ